MAFLLFLVLLVCYPPLGILMLIIGIGARVFKKDKDDEKHGKRKR